VAQNAIEINDLTSETWEISSTADYLVKKRIDAKGVPLKDWDISINYGIKTGFNEAYIIDNQNKNDLIAQDPKNAEIIKPILRGRDIKRYQSEYAGLWLINTHNGYKNADGKKIDRINVEKDFPYVYKHLQKYQDKLEPRADQGDHWTNLRNCAYIKEFEKDKIAWGNLALSSQFAYVKAGFYINAPSPLITPANKYILAILNSRVGGFYIRSLGVTRSGGYFEYKPMFVERVPVPQISQEQQQPFEKLVDQILSLKKQNLDSGALEKEIDVLVYKLYELTYNEVKIVDKDFSMSREEYEYCGGA
jgi:adenine-specific DNA-methyltransferase